VEPKFDGDKTLKEAQKNRVIATSSDSPKYLLVLNLANALLTSSFRFLPGNNSAAAFCRRRTLKP
jgi:hypothetical protein